MRRSTDARASGREQVTREEEHRERAAHSDEREGHAEVCDQHVLEHVRRLEVLLGDRVERRDDPDHDDRHACAEERDARPGRKRCPSSVKAAPAVEEEGDRDCGEPEHERVERPRAPEVLACHGLHCRGVGWRSKVAVRPR